ncbi:glycosyltransferase family 4 protein [Devosia enhydra]|uniref:glycosyltransferase family 4 protein n=1 Tax=Devosia enhydra TaxID=665118 RepID=UPI000930AB40|nr:glycosyltransferase family 4 protein [Devosia enhydra]
MRVIISANTSWNLVNFRSSLIRVLIARGYEVIAVAPRDKYSDALVALGCRYISVEMDNKGTNPVRDLALTAQYLRIMRRERPDLYLGWTIKPNIYGSLSARAVGAASINNISGLGTAFLHGGMIQALVKALYKIGLIKSERILFQNDEDRSIFVADEIVEAGRSITIPGSGINLDHYEPQSLGARSGQGGPVFLLIARMLRDKGVEEFVEAARQVRAVMPAARFQLLGFLDVENRTAIARSTVEQWVAEGVVEYLGVTDDVRPFIAASDCVVLPSYREGTPRTLLEAMAMGRPLVATDVPGCRETVDDGVNGWLCRVKDAADLAEKMLRMARASPESRAEMGRQSRLKAEREFDERIVIDAYLKAIDEAMAKKGNKATGVPDVA